MAKKKDFTQQARETVEGIPPAQTKEDSGESLRMEGTKRMRNARLIDIDKIKPDPNQPRKTIDPNSLEELSNSIKEHGILQPITVEHIEAKGYYKLITGERRFQAAKKIGLDQMPCIVQGEIDSKKRYAHQLIENIQREDLNPIEKAVALLDYKNKLGSKKTWEDVTKETGISKPRLMQFIALLKLPDNIQREIVSIGRKPSKNMVTEKHARALLMLNKFPEKQLELFNMIKDSSKSITGDDAIEKAKGLKGKMSYRTFILKYTTDDELIEMLESKLSELKKLKETTKKI